MAATTTGVMAPRDAFHQATMLWPPQDLRNRESFSPAGQDIGFAVLPVDTLVAGAETMVPSRTGFHTVLNVSCSHHGIFVGVIVPLRQPLDQVPPVKKQGMDHISQ